MERMKTSLISFFLTLLAAAVPALAQDFLRVEQEAGLGHVTNNHGVSVADYDQDGDLDIFLVGYDAFDHSDGTTWNRLLSNDGDGTFEDVTIQAGFENQYVNTGIPAARGEKMGASWGDYDNDGYPDLFLTNSREDQLYHNEGNGTFVDVTGQAGVASCFNCYSGSGLWWDHDRDGDLDLYVSQLKGDNVMYENTGDSDGSGQVTFVDITQLTNLAGFGITWASVPLDLDKDGFLDLYLVNDNQENQLFENRFGSNWYIENAAAYKLNDEGAGMGVTVGDYNNDGLFDIYVTNIFNHHPNPLFTYIGNPRRFDDLADEMGVADTGWGWGTKFFDCDHDGDEDLYAVNGVEPDQVLFGDVQEDVNNFFFKNLFMEGTESFVDWSVASKTDELANARGLEVFDYDNDGDLDMVVANTVEAPFLFRNELIVAGQTQSDKNWIKMWLEGTLSNRDAIGTEVKITIDGNSYYRWYTGAGFFSQSLTPVHFGLASAEQIDEIQVTWPLGLKETFFNIPVNQTIRIREGDNNITTAVEDEIADRSVKLNNFPNPFYNSTTIQLNLPKPGYAPRGDVELSIFSVLGKKVYQIEKAHYGEGVLEITWDEIGNIDAGIYYCILNYDGFTFSNKMLKIK